MREVLITNGKQIRKLKVKGYNNKELQNILKEGWRIL